MNQGPEYKRDWIFDRCREVQADPDEHLDLWAREHYKSTIITFGLTIQDNLNNPELTFGFFSFNRPIAKAFLNQIKREYQKDKLKALYPDVLWRNPEKEAPKWSENEGIFLKRKGNPREATIEAWGLVDGQPTSKHFDRIVYDDIVTEDSVTNIDKIKKVTKYWELSLNLCKDGGKRRYAGTYYHYMDTYAEIRERGTVKAREYPGTDDGTITGKPVLYTPEYMAWKKANMSSYVFACQVLLDPKADSIAGFKKKWLKYWDAETYKNLNIYMIVDPASSKKHKDNDYTVIDIIGAGPDENFYWITGIRDRLTLIEKTRRIFTFVRMFKPLNIGYEEYGLQADIEYIEYVQGKENFHFDITPLGGSIAKDDRIERWLLPLFQKHRFFIPTQIIQVNYQKEQEDIVKSFLKEEYHVWPYCLHDDGLDNKARIMDPDMEVEFPEFKLPVLPGQDTANNEWDPLRG